MKFWKSNKKMAIERRVDRLEQKLFQLECEEKGN